MYPGGGVIPLELSGLVDAEAATISYSQLLEWGLANLKSRKNEAGYAVIYGNKFANTWGGGKEEENFYKRAFPTLFPYGEGGIYRERPTKIDFLSHVRYLLQLQGKTFRVHKSFPFVAFNSYVRQEAFRSADIQMRNGEFVRDATSISSITVDMLKEAVAEE